MRIECPYCGSRDSREFTVLGDARLADRPDAAGPGALGRFVAYLHERDNPAGLHPELWYHGAGCQSWLIVTRDTRTHRIQKVEAARDLPREGALR
ncbi:MAG: sarcosine oxidase subunit delta [Hyphomicrobiaceae bacterium]|nr:sarcosine oxidase subunit delta [Hyphomicrobiaceae bacterium]